MITTSKQISTHFHSTEFRCPHCRTIKIDENLVTKLEHIFSTLNASKCIISSGYRCPYYDERENGFAGYHSKGLAADCCYYDKNGKIIPSKIVICVAYDLGELKGIANIDGNYTHLDNRTEGFYRGDERVSNNSCWTNPYSYFGVSQADVEKYTGKKTPTPSSKVNIYYRVKTQKHGWLEEVKNLEDYAGWQNSPITDIAIRVDKGSIKYRVSPIGKDFLPYVTGYNIKDGKNGFAGNGTPIDRIEVYYNTPNDIRPYKKAKYKVNNYSWQYDNEKSKGQDGFAGEKGVAVTKFQITIE